MARTATRRAIGRGSSGGGGAPGQLVLQPDDTAGVDTYISTYDATTAHPTSELQIGTLAGYIERTLIKFDLTDLPADAVITSAVLSLYAYDRNAASGGEWRVYRLKRAWVETEATWNVYSSGNNWATAGGFHADDCEQTEIGALVFPSDPTLNEFKDIPLTPTSKADLDLGNGWLIKTASESGDFVLFRSSDYATAGERPKLVIDYIA